MTLRSYEQAERMLQALATMASGDVAPAAGNDLCAATPETVTAEPSFSLVNTGIGVTVICASMWVVSRAASGFVRPGLLALGDWARVQRVHARCSHSFVKGAYYLVSGICLSWTQVHTQARARQACSSLEWLPRGA